LEKSTACLGDVAEDRFERGVLEFRLAAHLFGDRFHQFDVETGVVAGFPLLERGIGDVGADAERFAAPAFAAGFAAATAGGAVAAATAADCHN
jgi:hypothetical protein